MINLQQLMSIITRMYFWLLSSFISNAPRWRMLGMVALVMFFVLVTLVGPTSPDPWPQGGGPW